MNQNQNAMESMKTISDLSLFYYFVSGSRGNYDVTRSKSGELDDSGLLLKNTKDNEYVHFNI